MRTLLLPFLLLSACGTEDTDTDTDAGYTPGPFTMAQGDPEGECLPSTTLKPRDEADIDTWVAGRLSPPGYPARIDEVVVRFDGRVPCTIAPAALVRVFVGGDTPPDEPVVIGAGESESGDGAGQVFTLTLNPTPELAEGEHLYVQVEYTGEVGASRCATLCQDADESDAVFWSNAEAAPFSWTPISDDGTVGRIAIAASGEVLAQ